MTHHRAFLQWGLAAGAMVFLLIMLGTGTRPGQGQFVAFEEAGILEAPPSMVQAVVLADAHAQWRVERSAEGWRIADERLSRDLATRLTLAMKFLHAVRPVRELKGSEVDVHASEYGLDRPAFALTLALADRREFAFSFGGHTPDGMLQYVRIEGQSRVCLMSGFVGEEWRAVIAGLR